MGIEIGSFSLGGLAGTLLGVFAAHFLSKQRDIAARKVKEFNKAAAKFRAAFNDELILLDPALSSDQIDTSELLEKAFDKHRIAVSEFLNVLDENNANELHKLWQKYYRFENAPEITIHGLVQYSGYGCSVKTSKERRLLAAQRIKNLINFARNK